MTSRRLKDAKGQEGSLGLPLSQKQPYDYSRKDGSLGPVHREKRLFEPPGSFEPTLLLRMQRGGGTATELTSISDDDVLQIKEKTAGSKRSVSFQQSPQKEPAGIKDVHEKVHYSAQASSSKG